MYFSRTAFTAEPAVDEEAQHYAQEAVQLAERYFNVRLDGSAESMSHVEQILERVHQMLAVTGITHAAAEPFAWPFGSYFGELLRARYGGVWGTLSIYGESTAALQIGADGIVLVPWRRALERIIEGPARSLVEYHNALAHALATAGTRNDGVSDTDTRATAPCREFYPLRHDQGYFETGTTADGRQVLMSDLFGVFFDADGVFLGCDTWPLLYEPQYDPRTGRVIRTPEYDAALEAAVDAWKDALGLHEEPIRVRRFYVPEHGIGIEDRPEHYEEFLKAPELDEPDEDERHEMFESIRQWDESGSFVLYWWNDLWVNGEGVVTSS
jgi:hypothetical protein